MTVLPNTSFSGWSGPETGLPYRWTEGSTARIALPIAPAQNGLVLHMKMGGLLNPPALVAQRVQIIVNGRSVGEFQVSTPADHEIVVPAELIEGWKEVHLELQLPDAKSPKELGHSIDARRLGIYLFDCRVPAEKLIPPPLWRTAIGVESKQ